MRVSVVILTYNSQKYLKEVIESALFADEILILDSYSSDDTVKIAQELGARVERSEWLGFGKMKQLAVSLAKNDWVFVLDSDELISPQLQDKIKRLDEKSDFSAYLVPRLKIFFGRQMRHGGLYPDETIRLFDRDRAKFSDDSVHERVVVNDGKIGRLSSDMIHYAYDSIESFITKQNRYSTLGAKPNRVKAIINPTWTFIRMYILKLGFLDGWEGYITARLYAQYTFWKYIKDKR